MELELKRFSDNGESTLGLMYIDGKFECFTLEDTYRENKIKHETCIPAGRHRIHLNKYETPMTERYRSKYSWFNYHIELKNVPNYTSVYIHIGNDKDDTSGCILVADSSQNNINKDGFIGNSSKCFKRFYSKVVSAVESGEDVFINIKEDFKR